MIEAAQPQLARRAFDEELALYGIEQTQAFGIERMYPDQVLSGQKR